MARRRARKDRSREKVHVPRSPPSAPPQSSSAAASSSATSAAAQCNIPPIIPDEAMRILEAMREVHELHHKSLVLVLTDKRNGATGLGSGFIIQCTDTRALVMTCYHVVRRAKNTRIRLAGSSVECMAWIPYVHKKADIAILSADMPCKYPALMFHEPSEEDVPVGDLVFLAAYFHPKMLRGLCVYPDVHPGRICALLDEDRDDPEVKDVVHSCRSQPGCSGGALIYDGKVIGVHFEAEVQMEKARSSETVNAILKRWLCIPTDEIRTTEEMIGLLDM